MPATDSIPPLGVTRKHHGRFSALLSCPTYPQLDTSVKISHNVDAQRIETYVLMQGSGGHAARPIVAQCTPGPRPSRRHCPPGCFAGNSRVDDTLRWNRLALLAPMPALSEVERDRDLRRPAQEPPGRAVLAQLRRAHPRRRDHPRSFFRQKGPHPHSPPRIGGCVGGMSYLLPLTSPLSQTMLPESCHEIRQNPLQTL